jgi:hypothetical protein
MGTGRRGWDSREREAGQIRAVRGMEVGNLRIVDLTWFPFDLLDRDCSRHCTLKVDFEYYVARCRELVQPASIARRRGHKYIQKAVLS